MTDLSDPAEPDGDGEPLARVEQRLKKLEGLRNTPKDVDASLAREAGDRSWIARTIIWIFVGVIAAGLGILVAGAAMTGEWQDAGDQTVDLIKSTVLPIVTLVLGYYFGRSGKG